MKIGVAIPCYKYHIPLLKRCLDSIENQTVKPDIVVVSCSSCVKEDIPIEYTFYSFPIHFLTTEQRKNASENRNIAGNYCLKEGIDYISFFDCDDVMHPQRMEILKKVFIENEGCEFIIHNFYLPEEYDKEFEKIENSSFYMNSLYRNDNGFGVKVLPQPTGKRVPHGHFAQVSVSKKVFEKIKFREEKEFERIEDSFFCGDCLIDKNVKTVYIYDVLSKYFPEGKTVF